MAEEEQTVQEGRAVASFRKELVDGNFEGAKVIEREQAIPPQAIRSIINSVYELFLSTQRFVDAIDLAKRYSLSKDMINDAIYMEFRRIIGTGDVDKAIEWAMVYNLPDYEINRAAIKGIETAILSGNIEMAIDIKKKYSIAEDSIGTVWQKGFDAAFRDGDFFNAALLSREFGMSERKTAITAAKAFRAALDDNNFDRLILTESEFFLFNDETFGLLGDEEGRFLIKNTEGFFKKQLRSENFRRTVEMIQGLGILYKEIKNHILRDLWHFLYNQAIEIHEKMLHEKRYDDAFWMYKELSLNEDNTPEKIRRQVFNQAVTYHNLLLKNGEISSAQQVKGDYELLGGFSNHESINLIQNAVLDILGSLIQKGETKTGNQIIKEYNIPQEEINDVVRDAVIELLNKNDFDRAIDIVEKFNVGADDYDIKMAATNAFDYCRNSGYNETAADLGFLFQLDMAKVREAAMVVWENHMQNQNYRKAASLKRKFKLSKKMTDKIALTEYERLMEINDIEKAKKIRAEYRVRISIFTMLIEFIKKLILLFFGGTESDKIAMNVVTSNHKCPV